MTEEFNEVPSTTPDFTTEAASQLAELFPEVVADGKINLDTLKTILDIDVEEGRERFGLTWPGKRDAIRAAQTPTTATLMPDKEESVDWDTTQNVFIEGDNLEVLKVLQKHYYGQIKMIYIDPPYNTGSDFVYSDDYRDPIGTYLDVTGQRDGEGKLSTNTESAGRFHSNWLNMMYPRLKLARNLLTQDGIVFISIDEHENTNLQNLCEQIFGVTNYLGTISVVNNLKGRSDDRFIATAHEYLQVYSRDSNNAHLNSLPATDKYVAEFNKRDDISRYKEVGLRKTGKNSRREDRPNMYYPIYYDPLSEKFSLHPSNNTVEIYPLDSSGAEGCWRWGVETFTQNKDTELTARQVAGKWNIYVKMRDVIDGKPRGKKAKTIWQDPKYDTAKGNDRIEELFGNKAIFVNTKPPKFIIDVLRIGSDKSGIILDFFAGSGTTAHAVMQLNAEDGGNRRCISVQLPEPTGEKSEARKAGFKTISEITRECIRRAGKKILEDEAENLANRTEPLDVGFRAYKLVDTNFRKWRADSGLSKDELVDLFSNSADSANDHARPEALLTEVLLKLGLSLTEKIETVEIAGLSVFSVADGLVLAYLDEHTQPTLDQLRALVAKEPERLVVLEDAFQGNDELKTNLAQECRTRNVDLWTA